MQSHALYTPLDVGEAHETWGATCGPAALAAILGQPLTALRPFLDGFEARGYMNITHLVATLRAVDRVHRRMPKAQVMETRYGLFFVQWEGPWTENSSKKNIMRAYKRTHWVGVAETDDQGCMLYDVNANTRANVMGGWLRFERWHQELVPTLTETVPEAYGTYFVRWACEIARP